jgi:hypothetical protein
MPYNIGKDLFPTGCTEREKKQTDGPTLTPDGSHQPRSAASHRSLASLLCSLPRTHSPRDAPGGGRRRRRCRRGRSSPIFLSLAPLISLPPSYRISLLSLRWPGAARVGGGWWSRRRWGFGFGVAGGGDSPARCCDDVPHGRPRGSEQALPNPQVEAPRGTRALSGYPGFIPSSSTSSPHQRSQGCILLFPSFPLIAHPASS